jgi:prepilin peptidase CpaA
MIGDTSQLLKPSLLVILLVAALYTDLKYGKIFNKLTLPCMVLGIIINTCQTGSSGFLQSAGGTFLVLSLFLLFAKVGGMGGGDIKLLMAIGGIMGIGFVARAMLLSAVVGGVLALVIIARRRVLLSSVRSLKNKMIASVMFKAPLDFSQGSEDMKFRYSPAIVLGTLLTLLLKA